MSPFLHTTHKDISEWTARKGQQERDSRQGTVGKGRQGGRTFQRSLELTHGKLMCFFTASISSFVSAVCTYATLWSPLTTKGLDQKQATVGP